MKRLKIAVQKKGRLSEDSLNLLKKCGIVLSATGKDNLIVPSSNFPIEVLFLRDDDIPKYVERQVADIGIVGENEVLEQNKDITILKGLGIAKCRLSLAIPKNVEYHGLDFFENKKIATSYPNILKSFFKKQELKTTIEYISGSVEISPNIGLSDGICDLVSSGNTLFQNGLKEVAKVLDSQAVIVSNKNLDAEKKKIIEKILFRIETILKAKKYKYILLNAPKDKVNHITTLIPGMKSPTVLPLKEEGWCSIHTVVEESAFWEVIDELKKLGAEGILLTTIDKMVL